MRRTEFCIYKEEENQSYGFRTKQDKKEGNPKEKEVIQSSRRHPKQRHTNFTNGLLQNSRTQLILRKGMLLKAILSVDLWISSVFRNYSHD